METPKTEQNVKMINTELPDIVELKNIRQAYKDDSGKEKIVIEGLNLLIEDHPDKGEFVVLLGKSGCGKCVAKGTWIVTSKGLRRIEDLFSESEMIEDKITKVKNGELSVVVNKTIEKITHKYYGGVKETIKITSDNGVFIEGTKNHPVLVLSDGIETWKEMKDITENDLLIQEANQFYNNTNHKVSLPRAVPRSYYALSKKIKHYKEIGLNAREISKLTNISQMRCWRYFNDKNGKIINPTFKAPQFLTNDLCYYLGLLAGDGSISKGGITLTNMDKYIIDFFIKYTKNNFNTDVCVCNKKGTKAISLRPNSGQFYKNWITNVFGHVSNADTKDVPKAIRNGSFSHQLSFLQGLMDTDGSSCLKEKRAEISLNSELLINFVCAMLSSLGIYYTRKKRNKSHRVSIKQNPGISMLFRMDRKVQQKNENVKPLERSYLKIKTIKNSKSEVFDLTNPESHSFIANSLVVHNSSCLRYICGLSNPTSGEVLISGRPRSNEDRIGMVFQQYSSLEHMTVLDNVALGLRYKGMPKKERNARAMEMIVKVGLEGHENKLAKYPTLSGGQLQRVAIARSLAYDSKILLMDEPFGALDVSTRSQMQDLLADIWVSITPTIIMVTHDISEAVYLGDNIYVMGGSPANIVKEFKSPLPLERNRGMKRSGEFTKTVQEIEDFMS